MTNIMMTNTESIQQLYLAYFQRPAEGAGLNYWNYALSNGYSLSSIRDQIANASEFQALIANKSHTQVVDAFYLNLFGRHADVAGLTFYANALDHGDATVSQVVESIINGASGADADIVYNKVVAAELFTTALGIEPDNAAGYLQDPTAGKAFLGTVTDDASLYTALGKLPDSLEIIMTHTNAAAAEGGRTVQGTVVIDSNAMTVEEAVEQLYVAYFKRPADVAGLNFWTKAVATGTTELASKVLSQSAEYQATIKGLSKEQIVDNVYLNLFGHHGDSAGLKFYSDALASGAIGVDQAVRGIISGAQAQDRDVLENRTVAAELFTTSLNIESALQLAYPSNLSVGKSFIDAISSDASVYTAVRGLPAVLHDMVTIIAEVPPAGVA
jgi:type III secretion system FlhB-like substrate exporter